MSDHAERVEDLAVIEPTAAGRFDSRSKITSTWRVLDALSAAARAGDQLVYQQSLASAHELQITDHQICDAYGWGRRGMGAADFDHHGLPR